MAVFQVLIGGIDRTSVIQMDTFTAEIGSRENITTCSFDIVDHTRSLEVKGAESVVVKQDATTIWSGFVGNVTIEFDGNVNLLAVDAQSGNNMLDQKAYRTIGYVSKGVAGSANDKGSIRPASFSRTFGAEVLWLLSNSTCSPFASPITYSSSKIYKATNSLTARVDYGGKTLREALELFVKKAYGTKKMTFWVDAVGALNIQPTGQSANMLENFDFYEGDSSNWTLVSGASVTSAAGQSTGAVGAGSVVDYGIQLDDNTEYAYQNAAVVAGRRYYVAAALKNQSANRGQLKLIWKNSVGVVLSTSILSSATIGSWVRLEGVYTAPATATSVDYTVAYTGTTSGAAYFDNLQIIEENSGFGISDTPNNTTTFAPEGYEESVDSSAIINAVAIKGKKYTIGKTLLTDGNDAWQTYYVEYAPSIAYFGKVFTTALDDEKVSSAIAARNAAYKIFSESAFPIREGKYSISSSKLGGIVPTVGTYQIFELSRMPSARQLTISRIESIAVLPFGAGEIVYEIQFGAQKGNIASALATVGSAMWGTGKPKTGSTVFEHNFIQDNLFVTGRTLTDPQVTGVAAEVEQGAAISSIAPISVVKKNTALLPADNLPNLADYGGEGEFPLGSLILLVPDAGDPHITKPTLYRSDGTTTWTAVTPAQLKSDAVDAGRMGSGMVVADSIFAGTIDAGTIDVTNLNASNINAGALSLSPLSSNAITSTNFTVSNTGAVTAKDLTLIPSTLEVGGQGIDAAAGAITLEPPTAFGAVVLKVTNSDGTGDFDTVGFNSSAGAAANAPATVVTDAAHNLNAGQFVSFHSVGTTWNDIDASKPIQIITTPTTTSFTVEHFAALPAVASNSAGTIRAYKRLSVRAAGGLYVYRNATNAGDIAAGSLVLGDNLASYGKDSLATVADGELAFIKAATPRYGSGANLYSSNGTTNVSTSGNFTAAGGVNTTLVSSTSDLSLHASGSDVIVRDTAASGTNPRILFRDAAGTYYAGVKSGAANVVQMLNGTSTTDYAQVWAERFYPMNGSTASRYMYDDGTWIHFTSGIVANGGLYGDALLCDAIPTTTATTNAGIWVLIGSTQYGLRRNTSSARYKTDIVDIDDAVLEAAKKIKPRHFTSTIPDEAGATRLGFIAEEVEAAGLTHAVGYNAEGLVDTIDSVGLIAALFARVNDLEERLKALENKS